MLPTKIKLVKKKQEKYYLSLTVSVGEAFGFQLKIINRGLKPREDTHYMVHLIQILIKKKRFGAMITYNFQIYFEKFRYFT